MSQSSLPSGGSVNPPVVKRYTTLVRGARCRDGGIFPHAEPPKTIWEVFLRELTPSFRCLLTINACLREIHDHGWTLAIRREWLSTVQRRRDELEKALTRIHNNSPKVVHLVKLGQ